MDPTERLRPYVAGLATTWAEATPDVRHRPIEGSLAFVDISGFTTLTERLAAKGKIGAEEMSDLLNSAFATLLEVAYGYGASLVKWGGDAVLLLYEGPGHAAQACRGAFEMQRTMRRIGRLRTSVGVVQLRMSVGISSGLFDFFLVGDRHRELLVAGPAATETAVMEQIAEAGEVVVSAATAKRLPAQCLGTAKESGWLLHSAPPADPRSRWWPPTAPDIAGSCLDPALRDHLLTEVGDSEHRQVAVGFVEVSAVDGLLERQGPGAAAGALHDVVRLVQQACERHRVTFWETDISKDGFKILLIAGAPRSSGQDEDAMLRAARAILDGHAGPVRLRIGVNTGRVFNGGFGPPFRRTWSVKGDAVNLAARVMGKAETGQLLATEALLRRVASRVDADLLPPFAVKGKRDPVHAAIVQRVSAERVVEAAGAFIGRRAEMDILLGAAREAAAGRGGGIVITGEPGAGKSRLVDHVVNRLDETTTVLRGFADDYESATPYYAVRRMLRASLGHSMDAPDDAVADELRRQVRARKPDLEPWLPLLAVPFDVDLPDTPETAAVQEEFRRARTLTLVVDFLSALLTSPTVFLVDDVQVADDLSGELLGRLSTQAIDRAWLVLLVGRSAPAAFSADGVALGLPLSPLSADDARALVLDSPAGQLLTPHVIRDIVERGEGNPLFLHELTLAAGAADADELPSSLEELLAARIDDLDPAARQLLRSVSVLGSRFDESVVAELLDEPLAPDQWTALDHFLARHADGSRRFRTRLARDAAYEGLPFRRRVELHGRAATALQRRVTPDDDLSEALSLHYLAAQRYPEAFTHACQAGRQARALYANADAATFFGRALRAARHLSLSPVEVAGVQESLGDARLRLGEFDLAHDAYRSARRGYRAEPMQLARTQLRTAQTADLAANYRSALRWLATARRTLEVVADESAAGALRAEIDGFYGLILHRQGRDVDAVRWCRRAIAEADRVHALRPLAAALVHLDVCETLLGRGDGTNAVRALQLWQELGDAWQEARAHNNLGIRAYYSGRWDDAVRHYDAAADAALRAGDEWMATIESANVAEILSDQGRLAEAEPRMREVLRALTATGARGALSFGRSLLGRLLARKGTYGEALVMYLSAQQLQSEDGEQALLVETNARMAECLVWSGRLTEALETAEKAVAEAASVDGGAGQLPLLHRVRAMALAAVGDRDEALTAAEAALAAAVERDAPHERVWALDVMLSVSGVPDRELIRQRDELARQLGIVALPPAVAGRPADALVVPELSGSTGLRSPN